MLGGCTNEVGGVRTPPHPPRKSASAPRTRPGDAQDNDQVMPKLIFLCQSGIWPILCQLMAILAKLLDMDFKFVFFPAFILTLIYKPILKSIRPKLAILSPKILQKVTKMAISQNPILPKCHSSKSPANFGFWRPKSKIGLDYIYIDSECFRQIH